MSEPTLDVITIGRSSVDLYGAQVGGRLEDMASFSKAVGGCPTNIAIGTARLGLKSGLITRVGDEHMGRFIREQCAREGVDVTGVRTDPSRLTSLVILGIRDDKTFPLIFYRDNCADSALDESDIEEAFVARAKAIVVTGTHFARAVAGQAPEVRPIVDVERDPAAVLLRVGDGELLRRRGVGAREMRAGDDDRLGAHHIGVVDVALVERAVGAIVSIENEREGLVVANPQYDQGGQSRRVRPHAPDVDALAHALLADEAAHVLVADARDQTALQAEPRGADRDIGRAAAHRLGEASHVLQAPADLRAIEVHRGPADSDDVERLPFSRLREKVARSAG